MRRRVLLTALTAAVLVAGCSGGGSTSTPTSTAPAAVGVDWRATSLPQPPGQRGRIAVRDATSCDGTWYVVGAVIGPELETRPAAWTSTDGRTWRSMQLHPTAYYARRNILTSVACRDGRIAAVGARSGGAHGIPRTSSWYQRPDGVLVDMPAPFVLYGGSQAVDVGRVAAGPTGWVIAGNRTSGAAVWTSSDATDFRLLDDDPQLSSDDTVRTAALDAVADGDGWTLVGRGDVTGRLAPVPLAWTSADGSRWTRQQVPAASRSYADLQRTVRVGDGLVAVGIRDARFGEWQRSGDGWHAAEAFGRLDPDRRQAPFVSGLTVAAGGLLAAVSDGAHFGLWARTGTGDWAPVTIPTRPAATGDSRLTVAASGSTVLLLADDGTTSQLWLTSWGSG